MCATLIKVTLTRNVWQSQPCRRGVAARVSVARAVWNQCFNFALTTHRAVAYLRRAGRGTGCGV